MGWLGLIRAILELFGLIGREVHDSEQRKAGQDASQLEATNAEINRVNRAADAANSLPATTIPDPNDRDRKQTL